MDIQSIIVGFVVAVAAGWLLRQIWLTVASGLRGGGSRSCGSCSRNPETTKDKAPLVQLGTREKLNKDD
ncbi:hypothetical protein [Rubripirellula lacrimiformis]|uniref:hypothetical protein n=1 Tax=Rubripirellula lacrimiformis TaxID=1930273 RepID=UPI0011AB1E5E|nr:hypothetical protein [Rubripirellula lacrimiformis]